MKLSRFIYHPFRQSISFTLVIQCIVLPSSPAFAAAPISRTNVDLGKSTELKIGPGRISVLKLPEAIAEAKVGAPRKLKALLSSSDPRELTLYWIEPRAYRTNLIVRTPKRTFVFDVVPVSRGHQDLFEVRGSFGAPGFISNHLRNSTNGKSKLRTIHEGRIE